MWPCDLTAAAAVNILLPGESGRESQRDRGGDRENEREREFASPESEKDVWVWRRGELKEPQSWGHLQQLGGGSARKKGRRGNVC